MHQIHSVASFLLHWRLAWTRVQCRRRCVKTRRFGPMRCSPLGLRLMRAQSDAFVLGSPAPQVAEGVQDLDVVPSRLVLVSDLQDPVDLPDIEKVNEVSDDLLSVGAHAFASHGARHVGGRCPLRESVATPRRESTSFGTDGRAFCCESSGVGGCRHRSRKFATTKSVGGNPRGSVAPPTLNAFSNWKRTETS